MLFFHELESENTTDFTSSTKSEHRHQHQPQDEDEEIKKYIEQKYTFTIIINYLVEILLHFTKFRANGSLDLRFYLDNVFIKIIDIWGFIISYIPLYELLFENYRSLTKNQLVLFEKLKNIFLTYLYNPRIKPIELKDLENDLKELNNVL